MSLSEGDRVILTRKYIPCPEYPVWNSEHGCVGTVERIYPEYFIRWDNGSTYRTLSTDQFDKVDGYMDAIMTYGGRPNKRKKSSLRFDPNHQFRLKKIRNRSK